MQSGTEVQAQSAVTPLRAKARSLIGKALRNRRFQTHTETLLQKQYLNVGCGWKPHPEFVNLDYEWRPTLDVCWDITRPFPYPDRCLLGIYSEHCLEHIPFDAVDRVLAEFSRMLKPGGTVRIVVPDGELYLTGYIDHIRGAASAPLPFAETDERCSIYTPMMSVNRIFREHGHLFIYDYETFAKLLERNGFTNVARADFMKGRDAKLLIDSEERRIESVYIEAVKA